MRSAAAVALCLLLGGLLPASVRTAGAAQSDADIAGVPPGITLINARVDAGGRNRGRTVVVFADSAGRPLYFSRRDADCAEACGENWQPALASRSSRAVGDWALVRRAKGMRQWAFRGRPLYTFAAESAAEGNPPQTGALRRGNSDPPALTGQDSEGDWAAAQADPAQWMKLPNSVGVAEYPMAPGLVLAIGVGLGGNPLGEPLYAFSGTLAEEQRLPPDFRPRFASMLDLPLGDFTIQERADGARQWTFRGRPLYSCECDVQVGDLNGKDVAAGMAPATVLKYFTPPEVALKRNEFRGGYMVEARTGQTLYYRDRVKDAFDLDNVRTPNRMDPAVGATLGLRHCDAACENEWKPLRAPRNAQPQGRWSLFDRPDGTRQWAYHNHALYTRATEPPGTLFGNETYAIHYDEGYNTQRLPEEFGMAIMWRAVIP